MQLLREAAMTEHTEPTATSSDTPRLLTIPEVAAALAVRLADDALGLVFAAGHAGHHTPHPVAFRARDQHAEHIRPVGKDYRPADRLPV